MVFKILEKTIKKQFKIFLFVVLFFFVFNISFSKKIDVFAAEGTTIYLDLAKGNVVINATSYSGYNEYGQYVSGEHNSQNSYYVFQSYNGWDYIVDGIPNYNRLTYDGKLWLTYITNNTLVNEIASNWTTVATNAGRKSTEYYIAITGNSTYNVTIDNLWSTKNEGKNRETGGIAFIPTKGGRAIIKIKGDNRFGNIHYNYNSGDNMSDTTAIVFENGDLENQPGSMTVISYGGTNNHYNSVIGGNDAVGKGYACGMIFNSGIIYAGTRYKANYTGSWQIDNCSAIGGGGNETGIIEINGATVTAVAYTTGAAIGGGIGESAAGGKGIVTITAGDVYAYNFGYVTFNNSVKYPVPAAAIGGASSREQNGNTGQVTITGGNVYAVSVGGAAIGGGSSTKQSGGAADVTISGTANVIAKSIAGEVNGVSVPAGASIGGGTGGSLGQGNGGKAELTITGGTIKTGSIGGGACANATGKIGHAIVKVSGGNLQGQIVMAAGSNSSCQFEMTDGVLDNSSKTEEFVFLHDNGGAVYMNDPNGKATISGGIIQNCSANNGGAIYMTAGTFTMSGSGKINNCTVDDNGGAVYLGGGQAHINGGSITNCSADNGGAIYMTDGTFTMSGEGTIQGCTAVDNGGAVYLGGGLINISGGTIKSCSANNGGALYLTGGSVTMSGGTVSQNIASSNGGGINVSGGNVQMSGLAEISENKASLNGGGLYITNGDFLMIGGSLKINQALNGLGGGAYISTTGLDVAAKIYSGIIQGNKAKQNGGALSIIGTGSEAITVQIGVNVSHYNNEGNFVSCNHGELYGINVYNCPEIKGNQSGKDGGGIYISGSNTTFLNIYCIIEENNSVDVENSISDFMKIEGGAVTISAANPENDSDSNYAYGHNIINGSIHLTGGQMSIKGSMNNPQLNGPITVDIVDGSNDFFEDNRPPDDTYCKIQYFENYSEGGAVEATGQYTIFQLKKGDSYIIQGSIYYNEGYRISGWNTKKDGSGITYDVGVSYILEGDLILYAYWESYSYYIVYDAGAPEGVIVDGTMERVMVSYNQQYQLDSINYIYKGYRFKYWEWNNKQFLNEETVLNLSKEDGTIITLIAVWEKCEHIDTFVYSAEGSVLTKSCTCLGFDETITIKVPLDIVYDGNEHIASLVSVNEEWMSRYTIKYVKNGVETTPINAGKYTVSISEGDVTATATLFIEKAEQAAPEAPTYSVVDTILTVDALSNSTISGARVMYQLAFQKAGEWTYPDFIYNTSFTLDFAYTNYNVFVKYEETENYKESIATMAVKVYYFTGNVVLHLDNQTGLLATAEADKDNSKLIINIEALEGYYLQNVVLTITDDKNSCSSVKESNELFYLSGIASDSTIKIKVTGAVIITTINSSITPNEVFTSFNSQETKITSDSSFTVLFDVKNYVGYENLTLNFDNALTIGSSVILIDKSNNSYWYININSLTSSIAIEQFTRMGGTDAYELSSANFKLQFIINLGAKVTSSNSINVYLNATVKAESSETPGLVEKIEEALIEDAEFMLEEVISNVNPLEKTFNVKFGESSYESSEWKERSASIVVSKIGNVDIPQDLKILVESRVGSTIKTASYGINEDGMFIIPVSIGTEFIKLTLSSNMFPEVSQDYKFNIDLYASNTLINKSPINGFQIITKQVTFTSPAKFKTGAKIECNKKVIDLNGELQFNITINKTNDQTYTMTLMYKSEEGEYVNTGWKFSVDNITITSNNPLQYNMNLSMAGQKAGSYCIMVVVKDAENFTVISVPYYFIVK